MKQEPELLASQALSAVEKSRREMLHNAARTLLEWNLSVEVIMEITKLSKEEIEGLRGSMDET
ncbi:MAG: hypothetical protein FWD67_02610 [Betaproteobacteria bacterium]|nr:hypothetical protein [Betaproteobacteria bacterium]